MSGGIVAAVPRQAVASEVLGVSAREVQTEALERALEARAENLTQQRLLDNDTREIDSLREVLEHLAPHAPRDLIVRGRRLLDNIAHSNLREGHHEQRIAGWSDRLTIGLHAGELAGRAVGVKALAGTLRSPLDALAALEDQQLQAVASLAAALSLTSRERLLSASMANQLGPRKTRTLHRICGEARA